MESLSQRTIAKHITSRQDLEDYLTRFYGGFNNAVKPLQPNSLDFPHHFRRYYKFGLTLRQFKKLCHAWKIPKANLRLCFPNRNDSNRVCNYHHQTKALYVKDFLYLCSDCWIDSIHKGHRTCKDCLSFYRNRKKLMNFYKLQEAIL